MSINTEKIGLAPSENAADLQMVMDSLLSGTPLDPEVGRRIADRAEQAREELLKRGMTNAAVELIRECRNE